MPGIRQQTYEVTTTTTFDVVFVWLVIRGCERLLLSKEVSRAARHLEFDLAIAM